MWWKKSNELLDGRVKGPWSMNSEEWTGNMIGDERDIMMDKTLKPKPSFMEVELDGNEETTITDNEV